MKLLTCYEPGCSNTLLFDRDPKGAKSQIPDVAGAGARQTLRSQPDPSPNAPRDEILSQGKPSLLTSDSNSIGSDQQPHQGWTAATAAYWLCKGQEGRNPKFCIFEKITTKRKRKMVPTRITDQDNLFPMNQDSANILGEMDVDDGDFQLLDFEDFYS